MLVRGSSRMGVLPIWGPGLEWAEAEAWSLCCQQYRSGSLGSSTLSLFFFDFGLGEPESRGRLHGRPLPVTPRHVVSGFLESDLLTIDSGVLAVKEGIVGREAVERSDWGGRGELKHAAEKISKVQAGGRLKVSSAKIEASAAARSEAKRGLNVGLDVREGNRELACRCLVASGRPLNSTWWAAPSSRIDWPR